MQRDLDASRLEVVHLTAAVKRLEGELEVRCSCWWLLWRDRLVQDGKKLHGTLASEQE